MDVVLAGDYMVKLDLQDISGSPTVSSICKYLRFCWKGEVYEFQLLPFSLALATTLHKAPQALVGFFSWKEEYRSSFVWTIC